MRRAKQTDLEEHIEAASGKRASREERLVGTAGKPAKKRYVVSGFQRQHDCEECSEPFWTTRNDQHFCSKKCRKDWNNRRATRGAQLYDLAMRYRATRAKGSFAALTAEIDRFVREDREAGRTTFSEKPRGLGRQ